jgi:hypothetical protein
LCHYLWVSHQFERNAGISQNIFGDDVAAAADLGRVRFQKFPPDRRIIKDIPNFDRQPGGYF